MAARSPMSGLTPAQVEARHMELIRESDDITRKFELREQQELQNLQEEKRKIQNAIREERERLMAGMPAQMPFPESFDNFLADNLNRQIQKAQDEYDLRKVERKKLHDIDVLKHAEKWKTVLFSTQHNPVVSAPDLELVVPQPRPKTYVQISAPTPLPTAFPNVAQGPVHPRTEQARPAEAPRALGYHREDFVPMVPSQASQFAGIVVPQLLPRQPLVLSYSQVSNHQPRQHQNNVTLHHQHAQPRPVDVQPGQFMPAQPRMPEQPAVPKPRTALPDNGRAPEGMRQEIPRQTTQGSFNLPRILPLAEQQQHAPHPLHTQRPENELGSQHSSRNLDGTNWMKQSKRKADVQAVPTQLEPKRAKVYQETSVRDSNAGSQEGRKTITFSEVYQNGDPEHKHTIAEYPTNSRKYYILKCDEHGVHFNMNPLAGAAKHLHSAQHGNMSKERAQAVEFLGFQIVDCDEAKMRQHNEMVADAFTKGYKPLNLNQLSKTERASRNLPGDNSPTGTPKAPAPRSSTAREGFIHERPVSGPQAHQKIFTGITHPVSGELYLGYWATEKRNYAVLMLPFGDLKSAGMQGTLESTGLLEPNRVPRCYVQNSDTKTWGWAPGYEDRGAMITRREFPVMYFDGRSSVGWLRAKDLSPFNFDDPLWREIPYFKEAVHYYATVKGYSGFQEMREKNAGKDGRFFGRNQLGLQLGLQLSGPLPNRAPTADPAPGAGTVDNSSAHGDGRKSETAMVLPSEDMEMLDASPISDRDSYQESINRGMLDSDNDAEMANTESRRTSISNRGESQTEQGAPEKVLRQPFAQPVHTGAYPPRPVDMARQYSENSTGGVYRVGAPPVQMPPNATYATDGHGPRGPSVPGSHVASSRSPSELAQMIASRALHLQSPERDSSSATVAGRDGGSTRGGASTNESRPPAPNNGHGTRRVEKIYASNNPYRTSPNQSPSMATAMLSDRRSSPASLHNILQKPSAQTQPIMARPGPLSQNGPASFQPPQQGRHVSLSSHAPPLEQHGAPTAAPQPAMRSPSMLANFPRVPPSPPPPQPQGPGIRQISQSPVMEQYERTRTANSPPTAHTSNPPTRTPTPVILRSNSESFTTSGDRWRAVRIGLISQSETSTPQPSAPTAAVPSQHQPAPNGISTSPRPRTESPRESPLITPIATVGETRDNSTFQSKQPKASLVPFVKAEAGVQAEVFDLACVSNDREVSFDHSKTGGQLIRLTVDSQTRIASTAPDASVKVTIDPKLIRQALVQGSNVSPTASTVSLIMTNGKELELVFEMSDSSSGRIHARRFCRWMKSVNLAIDYKNASIDSTNPTRRGSAISGSKSPSATPVAPTVVNID